LAPSWTTRSRRLDAALLLFEGMPDDANHLGLIIAAFSLDRTLGPGGPIDAEAVSGTKVAEAA
jgi:hypothetical protein